MPKGIPKRLVKTFIKKVGRRPKGRNGKRWKTDRGGLIYLPTEFIGKKVKIEIFE